jgi:hypothetical protein
MRVSVVRADGIYSSSFSHSPGLAWLFLVALHRTHRHVDALTWRHWQGVRVMMQAPPSNWAALGFQRYEAAKGEDSLGDNSHARTRGHVAASLFHLP